MATKKTKTEQQIVTPTPYPPRTEVSIEKAKNGYVVSSYGDSGRSLYVAKTQTEAKTHANKLLKLKK